MPDSSQEVLMFALDHHCYSYKTMFTTGDNREHMEGVITRKQVEAINSHFTRKSPIIYTVHGVDRQCHVWTRSDQLAHGIDIS